MGDELDIDKIINRYSDPGLEFRDDCLELSVKCNDAAEKFKAWGYENLLRLKVDRKLAKGKIIDSPSLANMFGIVPAISFQRIEFNFPAAINEYVLNTINGAYSAGEDQLLSMRGSILEHIYAHSRGESVKIIGLKYFSYLMKDRYPFMDVSYYCSKRGEFINE